MATTARLPVIDGEIGGDIYGHATTIGGAMRVARKWFVDGVASAYRSEEAITLRDGSIISGAFVAVSGAA